MRRYLFIFSWRKPARFETVHERLAGKDGVEVILDRRFRERRRDDDVPAVERRQRDRRRAHADGILDDLGWIVVRR